MTLFTDQINVKNTNLLLVVFILLLSVATMAKAADLQGVLEQIEQLENKSDPKCYATASRLEDFMFGTPLTDDARFEKHQAEKRWIKEMWQLASQFAYSEGAEEINEQVIEGALAQIFSISQDAKGHWLLQFTSGGQSNQIKIHKDDKRQYSSIAYSLRSLLAVQQESLLSFEDDNLPLNQEAINALTQGLDLFSLSVLKVADQQARNNDQFEVDKQTIADVWQLLSGDQPGNQDNASIVTMVKTDKKPVELTLLKHIVEQKVRSYAAYNQISNQLFVRNLQVYFARNRWPANQQEATEFRQMFTETLISFAADLYKGAEQIALQNGRRLMSEADVNQYIAQFVPHRINEYEDAIFFPKLPRDQQVTIESYDMDAFRDSGIHWRYLQFAVFDPQFTAYVEPDPYAAELLVENIAQFGVLILRMTGDVGKANGEKRITLKHFETAMKQVQRRVSEHNKIKQVAKADISFSSSKSQGKNQTQGLLFSDVSQSSGIDYMHRSSDWLNRMLRSYLRTGKDTATSVIPPAFGGAGVAAEDINNDGLVDVLILGGLGNRLYLNRGDGRFEDITAKAGLNWLRAQDNQPGEARQPLIADINNDGLQDIVITYVNDAHRVYQNIGNAKFKDVTAQSGLGGQGLVGGPATVFDYDNDGLLDIYITYFGDYINGVLPTLKRRNDNGLANKLFRNTGNFKFVNVTKDSGVDNTGWGQAVTHADLNNDGLQDLIVGNDFGINAYYKNLGGGKFVDVAGEMGADKPSYTMGIGSADLNDDFVPDIYISNIVTMNKDEKYVMPGADTTMKFNPDKLAKMRVVEANDLFISTLAPKGERKGPNDGINYHLSQAVGRGYSSTGWSWDADFFDFDNDGDDDLYVLNGMNEFNLYSNENPYYTDPKKNAQVNVYIPVATKESNVFFVNDNGKLNNVSKQSGVDLVGNSRSATFFDLEGDGDLDMVLNNYHEKAVVYRNNAQKLKNNWLKVTLQGAPKNGVNLDAIGAQIIVTTGDGDHRWRLVQGSTGYMSVHPKQQHFGLQQFESATLKIKWPNGKTTDYGEVKANQALTIKYPQQLALN